MYIQTELTPNPQTLKFLPGFVLSDHQTYDFPTLESAASSPLVQRLFGHPGVDRVFIGHDFITVTKKTDYNWDTMEPLILSQLSQHLSNNEPVFKENLSVNISNASSEIVEEDEIVTQIKELIDLRVRPAVAQDGGDIIFSHYKDGIVHLIMQGACSGCPSSSLTLKSGIENMLKFYIPEITEVRAV